MNLKEVARRLGVHYQTAYRWARAGELSAVRVGARYEVSESALTQFLARREPPQEPAAREPRRAGDLSRGDALEELEAFALDPVVSVAAIVAFAAQRGSSVLGDLCVVAHVDASGVADSVSVAHAELDRATFARAALEIGSRNAASPQAMDAFTYEQSRVLRVGHVPHDRLQRALPRELQQYWSKYAVYSLLSVPIPEGQAVSGVMRFTRDRPDAPYTADDESFAVEYAARVGMLFASAVDIALAWRTRAALVDALELLPEELWTDAPALLEELRRQVDACVGTDRLPIVLADQDSRILSANETFEIETGHARSSLVGRPIRELTSATDADGDRDNFDQLVSGQLDFVDVLAGRILGDGAERAYATHRGAVRSRDGRFRCSVGVWRPLHLTQDDTDALIRDGS